jgi:hypothetical protein
VSRAALPFRFTFGAVVVVVRSSDGGLLGAGSARFNDLGQGLLNRRACFAGYAWATSTRVLIWSPVYW